MAPSVSKLGSSPSQIPAAVIDDLQNMILKATATGHFISAWEEMQAYLTSVKLGWFTKCLAEFVGVHKANKSM